MSIWTSPLWLIVAGVLLGFFLGTVVLAVMIRGSAPALSEKQALAASAAKGVGADASAAVGAYVLLAIPGFFVVPVLLMAGYFGAVDLPWWSWVAAAVGWLATAVLVARSGLRQAFRATGRPEGL